MVERVPLSRELYAEILRILVHDDSDEGIIPESFVRSNIIMSNAFQFPIASAGRAPEMELWSVQNQAIAFNARNSTGMVPAYRN